MYLRREAHPEVRQRLQKRIDNAIDYQNELDNAIYMLKNN